MAVATIFRVFPCIVFALRGITTIVRFWGLIGRKVGPVYFLAISRLFCWV